MTPETPIGKGQQSFVPCAHRLAAKLLSPMALCRREAIRRFTVRILRRDAAIRMVALIAAVLLSGALTGCSTINATSFSGGGVPIGGSRLFGRAVSAANPAISVPNVTIHVQATPMGGAAKNLQSTTGQDGSFDFSNVLPGFSNGTVQLTATPADAAYQSQQIAFQVANGHTQQVILTLAPANFDLTSAQSIFLSLASPAIPTGGTVQLQSQVRDATGNPLPVKPTLIFDGNFGTLNPDGTFSVPQGILSGSGTISAYWYSLLPQSQQVRVDNNAPPQPPEPPILPTSGMGGSDGK